MNLTILQHEAQKIRDLHQQGVGMSHCGLAIYIKKYLKAKEELWKFKYFTMQKYIILKKFLYKKPKSFKIL